MRTKNIPGREGGMPLTRVLRERRFTDVLWRIAERNARDLKPRLIMPTFNVWTRPAGFNDHGTYPERHLLYITFRPLHLGFIPGKLKAGYLMELQDRWREYGGRMRQAGNPVSSADEVIQPLRCIIYHKAVADIAITEAGKLAREDGFDGLEIVRDYPHEIETLAELEVERQRLERRLAQLDADALSADHPACLIRERETLIGQLRALMDGPQAKLLQLRAGRF